MESLRELAATAPVTWMRLRELFDDDEDCEGIGPTMLALGFSEEEIWRACLRSGLYEDWIRPDDLTEDEAFDRFVFVLQTMATEKLALPTGSSTDH